MEAVNTYYSLLEVSESANLKTIQTAYYNLVKQYHPDLIPSHLTRLKKDAEEMTQQLYITT